MAFGWLKKAVRSAGRALASVHGAITKTINSATELVGKVPLIGPGLHGVFSIAAGPFNTTNAVLHGQRVDKAVLDDLKSKVGAIREVAPYATTVISLMPGVGTGIAGALGTSLALAQGMPLDKAAIEGFKNAVPGGIAGKALFSVTVAAVSGENIAKAAGNAAIDGLHLPPAAKAALMSSLNLVQRAAKGENIPKAALEEARKNLPTPELQKAYDVAVAVGQGKNLQKAVLKGIADIAPAQMGQFSSMGKTLVGKTPVFNEVYKKLDGAQQKGYSVGMGLLEHSGVNENHIMGIRNKLSSAEKMGMDLAMASRAGAVMSKPPPKTLTNKQAAAYYATRGMVGATTKMKTQMLAPIAKDPEMKAGVVHAVAEIKVDKQSFWKRILEALGIHSRQAIIAGEVDYWE